MANRTLALVGGALLFVGAAIALLGSSLVTVDVPALAYVVVGVALFAGVYLLGVSYPGEAS